MKSVRSRAESIKQRADVLDILIAHDHEIVRIGLRALIKDRPELRVCGEASSTAETLNKVGKLQPEILMVRLGLPEKGALEILPGLLRLRPKLKILIFATESPTMEARHAVLTPTVAKRALEEGALGLVLRPNAEDFRLALDALSKNNAFVSSNIFDGVSSKLMHRTERLPVVKNLTGREVEVFNQMVTGKTTKEIAFELGNSPRTVEVQRASVMRKLGFDTQADLLLFALQHRAVELTQSATKSSGKP